MDQAAVQICFETRIDEHSGGELCPSFGVVPMIVSDDNTPRGCVFNVLQNILAESLAQCQDPASAHPKAVTNLGCLDYDQICCE
jgi:hypothetical protein